MKKTNSKHRLAISFASLITLLVIWQLAALRVNSVLILPSPLDVFARLLVLLKTVPFWQHLGATLARSFYSFLISLCISLLLGLCTGLFSTVRIFFQLPLTIIKATPVVSFILLALFWFTSSTVPIFVSILMTLPVMTGAIASGIQETDKRLIAMSRAYGFSVYQRIRFVYLPSIRPYFFSGALSSLGLTWKVVVAGEILSLPKRSVGFALQTAKVHLETVDVFAWTISVIVLSYLCELAFARYTAKWRKPHAN